MSSISKIIEKEISSSPFLEESIAEDLINISSLARLLKPKVEEALGKEVKIGALVMAINRLEFSKYNSINEKIEDFMEALGDIIIRSNLNDYAFKNSATLATSQMKLMEASSKKADGFCTISQGVYESNIVISQSLEEDINLLFKDEEKIFEMKDLSSGDLEITSNNLHSKKFFFFLKIRAFTS